jgi:hypothetical protein
MNYCPTIPIYQMS